MKRFFKQNYCHACYTKFASSLLSRPDCMSSLISYGMYNAYGKKDFVQSFLALSSLPANYKIC